MGQTLQWHPAFNRSALKLRSHQQHMHPSRCSVTAWAHKQAMLLLPLPLQVQFRAYIDDVQAQQRQRQEQELLQQQQQQQQAHVHAPGDMEMGQAYYEGPHVAKAGGEQQHQYSNGTGTGAQGYAAAEQVHVQWTPESPAGSQPYYSPTGQQQQQQGDEQALGWHTNLGGPTH